MSENKNFWIGGTGGPGGYPGGGAGGGGGGYVAQPLAPTRPAVRVVVTRSRKGWQWAQIARNGSAGAISPKTYDTKSNAVRAAKRQAALVGGVVEVL